MSFCSNCGNKLSDQAKYCFECGEPRENNQPSSYVPLKTKPYEDLTSSQSVLISVADKIKTSNIWWMVAMILQYISVFSFAICVAFMLLTSFSTAYVSSYDYYYDPSISIVYMILGGFYLVLLGITLTLAIISTVKFSKTRKLHKAIFKNPVGIVDAYKSTHPVVLLVFNIIFGGIVGIVASAMELSANNYVTMLTPQLLEIEKQASEKGSL